MAILETLRVDPEMATGGVWMKCPLVPGLEVLIAMQGNSDFHDSVTALSENQMAPNGRMSNESARAVVAEAMAETIFRGFRGEEGEDGERAPGLEESEGTPLEDTPKNRLMILTDPGLTWLADWITQQSNSIATFRAKKVKATAGKS